MFSPTATHVQLKAQTIISGYASTIFLALDSLYNCVQLNSS